MNKVKKYIKKYGLISISLIIALTFTFIVNEMVMAYSPQQLYEQVWKLVNTKYVDQTNNSQNWAIWRHKYDDVIKTEEDAYVAIATMLASLDDPYTKFLNPRDFAEETNSIKGSLKGIGVQIGVRDGKLYVIAPMEDTPGERAGLQAEDEILQIDGVDTKGISVDKAADRIRGEEGTTVTLLIKRKNQPPKLYKIVRSEINVKSVSQKQPFNVQLSDKIGYIRLSSFISKNTASEFSEILNKYSNKQGIIIDLRSNPGGLLSNAIVISDMLLNGGVIVSTVDRDGYKDTMRANSKFLTDKPIIILINKGSASASEILSGALKDNQRALIVGEKSFGKGLVQEINKLYGGSGVNITIQKYLTPNGTDINKKGIIPDVLVELTEDNAKNKDDVQLKTAQKLMLEMIENRTKNP